MASDGKPYGVGIVGLDHWYAGIGAAQSLRGSKRGKLAAVAHRDEGTLREFAAEHGEAALRELGGRREAEAFLGGQDETASVEDLLAALDLRA